MINSIIKALSNSRSKFLKVFHILSKNKISPQDIELIEEMLVETDIGYDVTNDIIDIIQESSDNSSDLKNNIKLHLVKMLSGHQQLIVKEEKTVIVVVGVNGSGKTTTAAKLAKFYSTAGKNVTLVAADTYRAAAVEQLKIWSERVGCRFIFNENSNEPASVVFNGLESAIAKDDDLVIVDTAGRLHTSENLMKELGKINRVIENRFSQFTKISLITIDASLGQNSIVQAREFGKICRLDGAVLTKLDGTAKGGVIFPLYDQLKIPVTFVGLGEGFDDLRAFNPIKYVDGIIDNG
ncbi:MAG: signal recognition particle-docking protein FtsY [Candidatus Neomarinimicrobiota bacterium]